MHRRASHADPSRRLDWPDDVRLGVESRFGRQQTMASSVARRTTPGPGRPRLVEPKRRGETAREEILDAAAELFTSHGYTGTSTRMIADAENPSMRVPS